MDKKEICDRVRGLVQQKKKLERDANLNHLQLDSALLDLWNICGPFQNGDVLKNRNGIVGKVVRISPQLSYSNDPTKTYGTVTVLLAKKDGTFGLRERTVYSFDGWEKVSP